MPDNVMRATTVDVDEFLGTVPDRRRDEARILIAMMREISGEEPTLWGPSIIGFGSQHYRYDTGREGDAPLLAFSPRKHARLNSPSISAKGSSATRPSLRTWENTRPASPACTRAS